MAETPALNQQEALIVCGGDEEMFLEFLRVYDEVSLNPYVLRLHKAIMKKDFDEIRLGGYFIKCGASYICATKVSELAIELQRKGVNKESLDSIIMDYIELLNEAKKLKKEIAVILNRPLSLDTADFDIFEKQIRTAYPKIFPDAKVSPVCQGCSIF